MVSETKKKKVQQLAKEIKDAAVIGLVDMTNLPAQQLQKMRSTLNSKKIKIYMTRKKLLELALKNSQKEKIDLLIQKIRGMPALILCQSNPFELYAILQKNKSEAPAKPGQIAPKDLIVKAGPTNFAPGPIISELAAVGIKTKVEAGKLAVMADTVIAKEGTVISQKVAETLKRMDIKPMEIGLNLVAVWESGLIFDSKQLHIDEAEFVQRITQAIQWATNLAVESAYLTTETTEPIIQKAFQEAKALALEANILTEETLNALLAKCEQQAFSIKEEAHL